MKKRFTLIAAALAASAAGSAMAADYGTVISKTPAYAQVSVPQRQCVEQEQTYRQAPSGVGGLLGALAGGAVGNALGSGGGRAAATGIGVIAGAMIGDRAEANAAPTVTTPVQSCQTVGRLENRFVGYDVVYEYGGQRYTARVPNDPGDRIALNVNVAPAGGEVPAPVVAVAAPTVVYSAPPVVYGPPVYGPVVGPVYGGPVIGISAGWGYGRHWR
jgi:uncharacterized protein YcfJ